MMKWWRVWRCKWFHRQDHVCFDDLTVETVLPGRRCYFCNKCKRVWHTHNPRKFLSEYQESVVTGEYPYPVEYIYPYPVEHIGTIYSPALWRTIEVLRKRRKRKDDNTTESSGAGTGGSDEPLPDATGPDGPQSSSKHSGECSSAGDGDYSPSV